MKRALLLLMLASQAALAQEIHDTRWWLINFGAIKEGRSPSEICEVVTSPEALGKEIYGATTYMYELIPTKIGYLHLFGSDGGSYVLSPTIDRCLEIARRLMLNEITAHEVYDIYLQPKEDVE